MTQPARSPYDQGAATTAGASSEDNKVASGEEGYELADRDAATTQDPDDSTVYRTYKRRWFGLAQLVLLNIVVSWDVSCRLLTDTPPHNHETRNRNSERSITVAPFKSRRSPPNATRWRPSLF